ncbi:MAG TPA: thiamine pyrophosphate-dependent dehydrogenase E1 component subunit alpha [Thermoanaerobaculia bacterium]|nr:thiamine pyrophosphate-dependent dehydrogenase E1 component subunit alpha [Thermoanaerobaculia bacterium]
MTFSLEQQRSLYRHLLLTRRLEERMVTLYRQGKMTGGLYRCLGQEATAVGTAFALEEGDLLIPVIRDLGSVLVRGARPADVLRQLLAKGDGPSRGRDGFLHFCLPEKGLYSGIAMLGTAVPVLAGMVLADRFLGKRTVGMTYLGEGGTSTGAFHEGINFAGVQRLPVVVVLEYNRYSYSTPSEMQCAAATLADKAAGYGIASAIVDGNDVLAVVEAARRAVAHAREGKGPFLLECKTYRRKGHAEHDGQAYVDAGELAEWARRDPIALFEKRLDASGVLDAAARAAVRAEVDAELDAAVAEAESSPAPVPDPEFRGVRADEEDAVRRRRETFVGGLA